MLLGDKAGYGVLGDVGILKFVYHELRVAVLVLLGDGGVVAQQKISLEQQVIEVNGVVLAHHRFVAFIDAAHDFIEVAGGSHGEAGGCEKLALGAGDGGLYGAVQRTAWGQLPLRPCSA